MCRVNCYWPASGGLGLAAENRTARENDGIDFPIVLDDGDFQVPVEWSGFNLEPYHSAKHWSDARLSTTLAFCRLRIWIFEGRVQRIGSRADYLRVDLVFKTDTA